MNVETLSSMIGASFYTGVPDSQLGPLCAFLYDRYGISSQHVIAANEGNAAALAAGYHLATGKVPVVYLQNSGLGNLVNPAASLLHPDIYAIPCLFIIGWRGEPGVHDEPQHLFQGEITLKLLEQMEIPAFVLGSDTAEEQIRAKLEEYRALFKAGRQCALVVRKGALTYNGAAVHKNPYPMSREEAIQRVAQAAGDDLIVATTGKASRELFELREALHQGHGRDFLTVGSMGHSSSIALGIAMQRPDRRVWCLDGDGAALMHMGAMALIGTSQPPNLIHVVLNNEAHESVGGMPTVAGHLDLPGVARACGYPISTAAATAEELVLALEMAKAAHQLAFLEVKCSLSSRKDLGRPTTSPIENKQSFMVYMAGCLTERSSPVKDGET